MNKLEFLNVLESHGKGKFRLDYDCLRATLNYIEYCPITFVCQAVTGEYFRSRDYPKAARKLGIDHELMNSIVDAADYAHTRSHSFRHDMLTVLGLD